MNQRTTTSMSTREVLLGLAEEMAATTPWHEVTMAKLAKAAGLSRQTVYNEFGTKQGLARAVALVVARRLLIDFEEAADAENDLESALAAGLRAAFEHASRTPLVRAVLTGESGDQDLLTVVTTDSSAVLELAGGAVSAFVLERWSELDPRDVAEVADTAIRLFVSHLLQPGQGTAPAATIARFCARAVA